MKILVVTQYYKPEQFLINDIAPELVRRGHDVTILTGLPNYPNGVVPDEYRHGQKCDEIIDGLRVIRCHEVGRKSGKLSLILNYISFALSGSRKARKLKDDYDVIFCYQLSPVTMALPAVRHKKKHGTPILLYCLDIWPESARAHVRSETSLLYYLIGRLSKSIYQACDRIAVTSEPFISYMTNFNGVPKERLIYIPQHADTTMLKMELSAEDNGVVDFLFAGNLGKGQRLGTLIKAASILKYKPGFVVHIVGDGSMRASLEQMAYDAGVSHIVLFHGQQSRDDMPRWYRKADALLITLRGNNQVGCTMPGKLPTYMTVGKPIFGAINGAARQVIEESECGACVPAEDADGLAKLMADYIDAPQKYAAYGDNARAYFKQHFTLPVFMDRLENALRELNK